MHGEALQKQAAAKRVFLEKKKNLDLKLKHDCLDDEDRERLMAIQKCMDNLYQLQLTKDGAKEIEIELHKQLKVAEKNGDLESKLLIQSIKDQMRENVIKRLAQSSRKCCKHKKSASGTDHDKHHDHEHGDMDPFKMQKLLERSRVEREAGYIKRVYNGLKFIKMIKDTDGSDPSNFIVSKKDKQILENS